MAGRLPDACDDQLDRQDEFNDLNDLNEQNPIFNYHHNPCCGSGKGRYDEGGVCERTRHNCYNTCEKMKSLRYILFALSILSIGSIYAQDYNRLSERDIMGTSRYVGMSGAMTAVGGDPSSVVDNPAGLGVYRRSEAMFIGAYAVNPANGKKIPIYAADYVLYSYGTGAVMGVPSHDERDFAFAKKYGLPITQVITDKEGKAELPYCEDGYLINSGEFDGLFGEDARAAIVKKLEKDGTASNKVNYRLRDWLISRQRYWGAPIPIIHCEHCGDVPVPYEDLPVKLPYDVEFKPDGKSPLAKHEGFMHTKCPKCGADALRDPDTLDTFVCSSWYYLRYADAHNDKMAFDPEKINEMLPVDKYVGGAEHACMHLLYARFITKALRDMGYLKFDEPFLSLTHQGVILGPDGNRMSKSRGNVISPDTYVNEYGSDVFRLYLLFGFNYTEGGPWNDDGIKSVAKFIDRVERLFNKLKDLPATDNGKNGSDEQELLFVLNNTIKAVDHDMNVFSFNTAIARLMELVNAMNRYEAIEGKNNALIKKAMNDLILLLAPCTPHFAEELWHLSGNETSVFKAAYPTFDESKLVRADVEYAVQINSKIKTRITLSKDMAREEIEKAVLSDSEVIAALSGATPKKIIVIPNRLVNIIC